MSFSRSDAQLFHLSFTQSVLVLCLLDNVEPLELMKLITCEQYEFYLMSGNVATAVFPYKNELDDLVVISLSTNV